MTLGFFLSIWIRIAKIRVSKQFTAFEWCIKFVHYFKQELLEHLIYLLTGTSRIFFSSDMWFFNFVYRTIHKIIKIKQVTQYAISLLLYLNPHANIFGHIFSEKRRKNYLWMNFANFPQCLGSFSFEVWVWIWNIRRWRVRKLPS